MEGSHSVTVFVQLKTLDRQPIARVCEPDKCYEWKWHDLDKPLPEPVFAPLREFLSAYRLDASDD